MTTANIKRRLDKLAPVTSEDGYSLWVGRPMREWPSSALVSFLIGQPVDAAGAHALMDAGALDGWLDGVAAGDEVLTFEQHCHAKGTTAEQAIQRARQVEQAREDVRNERRGVLR
jgi:hypothetical protein